MKKHIAILLMITLIISLTSCGAASTTATPTPIPTTTPQPTKNTEQIRDDFNAQYAYAFDVLDDKAEGILWDLYTLTHRESGDDTGIVVSFDMENFPGFSDGYTSLPETLWNDSVYEAGDFFNLLNEIGFSQEYISKAIEDVRLVGTMDGYNGYAYDSAGSMAVAFQGERETPEARQSVFMEEFSNPYFYRNGLNLDGIKDLNVEGFYYDDSFDGPRFFSAEERNLTYEEGKQLYKENGFVNGTATQNKYQDMNEIIKKLVFSPDILEGLYNEYPIIKAKVDLLLGEMAKDNPQFGSMDFWVNR